MKSVFIVLAVTLSIMFFSISIHNLAAQNTTNNSSNVMGNLTATNVTGNLTATNVTGNLTATNVTGNLTATNVTGNLTATNVTGNLTGFANQLTELGQKLSLAINETNMTDQTENSSFNLSGNNASS